MRVIQKGFTIVELIIVIIVIGILAAISIVSYNGAQDKAEFSRAQTDMKHINDAILLYRAKNGKYPGTNTTFQSAQSALESILVPNYLDKKEILIPKTGFEYVYIVDAAGAGTEYKLLRYKSGGLPSVESSGNTRLDTTTTGTYTTSNSWGYWSAGGSNL